jgi:hypothetical protein
MEKNWKKEFLQNLGAILLSGLWVAIGYHFTKDVKLDQIGQTIYFGENAALLMVAWFIPGLACIAFTYREIKLLIQMFLHGGTKIKRGCIWLIIIPVALFVAFIIFGLSQDAAYAKLHSPTQTAMAPILYGDKGNGTYKIGIDIGPGLWTYIPPGDGYCRWVIIANDGREILSYSIEGENRMIRLYPSIEVLLKVDDKEFRNIDCGLIKRN